MNPEEISAEKLKFEEKKNSNPIVNTGTPGIDRLWRKQEYERKDSLPGKQDHSKEHFRGG
jgi:hypothetical protein